jgi:transglutaminase-like putative cysteine protease
MKTLMVRHATTYRYAEEVTFGPHRLMIRPRDSHDLRLASSTLGLTPPGKVRWLHDVFGNSVAIVEFANPAQVLEIVSTLSLERYGADRLTFSLDREAATYPFIYSTEERADLGRLLEQHYPDPKGVVSAWARRFVARKGMDTLELLSTMNSAIKATFAYQSRHDEGTQSPVDTLWRKSGSCRDFALLLIEAARFLGFGARFVSGYLYDPTADGTGAIRGQGATHAWADIYLPGAGWVEYDPTNGLIAAENLIRVAVARDPSQAIPVSGSFVGAPSSCLGMNVDVTVTSAAGSTTTPEPPRREPPSRPERDPPAPPPPVPAPIGDPPPGPDLQPLHDPPPAPEQDPPRPPPQVPPPMMTRARA